MGILRIYLALCVVAGHTMTAVPWPVHTAVEAVQVFFIISGFYMALIQSKYPSTLEFYSSRFLRIFIPYWVVLALILVICSATGLIFGFWGQLSPYVDYVPSESGLAGVIIAAVTSVTVFFQDLVMFLGHEPGQSLAFTPRFWESQHPLWRYLLIPQAWSVSIELAFYLLVPFLNRMRSLWLFVLIMVSLGLRFLCYEFLGLNNDPWTYRFFPFEIALFALGMLMYRLYSSERLAFRLKSFTIRSGRLYLVFVIAVPVVFSLVAYLGRVLADLAPYRYASLLSYLPWVGIMPLLFALTRSHRLDRYLGNLSYPIYLTHFFLIGLVGFWMERRGLDPRWLGILTIIATLALSLLVMTVFVDPLERRRYALAKALTARASKGDTPS